MKQGKKAIDLTQGRPLVQLARFAVPLILGTLFQQFYTFTDTVIVGRCLGVDALAAVGVNASLHFLTLGFVQGSCIGFGIPAAQSFGARDKRRLHRYLWNGAVRRAERGAGHRHDGPGPAAAAPGAHAG